MDNWIALVKANMKDRKVTQDELARRLGMSAAEEQGMPAAEQARPGRDVVHQPQSRRIGISHLPPSPPWDGQTIAPRHQPGESAQPSVQCSAWLWDTFLLTLIT